MATTRFSSTSLPARQSTAASTVGPMSPARSSAASSTSASDAASHTADVFSIPSSRAPEPLSSSLSKGTISEITVAHAVGAAAAARRPGRALGALGGRRGGRRVGVGEQHARERDDLLGELAHRGSVGAELLEQRHEIRQRGRRENQPGARASSRSRRGAAPRRVDDAVCTTR